MIGIKKRRNKKMENEYCAKCGIKLPKKPQGLGALGRMVMGNKNPTYEFKDGTYCEKCAKIEVERRRKK